MREALEAILREAGEKILAASQIKETVTAKEGPANFVTKYDVAVQALLRQRLLELRPQAHFLGEEEDARDDVLHNEAFIVDPIDGTTNFIKGWNASAISVAMLQDGVVVVAATFDPYRQEFFYAEKGKGTTCNGVPVHVSGEALSQSLVCFGSAPYYPEVREKTFRLGMALMEHAVDVRRCGSAVIDLCEIARGAAGLFFEWKLSPWDYAACSLLITEAGGQITQMDGSPLVFDRPCSVLAGTRQACADFFAKGLDNL